MRRCSVTKGTGRGGNGKQHELFSSRDHLKRHFGPYLIPIALIALAYIVNLFSGILFTVSNDLYVVPLKSYYFLKLVEFVYLILPVIHYMIGLAKIDTKVFLHPFSIYVPILVGEVITILTPISAVFLGCSVGLTFLVFSRIDSVRFEDRETSFYNRAYIRHILAKVEEKGETRGSMIMFDIKGSRDVFVQILKESLPEKSEMIVLPGGRFIFLSDNKNGREIKGLTALVLDNANAYDEENPAGAIKAEGSYRIFKDDNELKDFLRESDRRA